MRAKSPEPKTVSKTTRKKVMGGPIKYETTRRTSRKPEIRKEHTINISKMMPSQVEVNLVEDVKDQPIGSLKQSLMNPLDICEETQKNQTE